MAKNAVITKLKDELDKAIELVVRTRESMQTELANMKHSVLDKIYLAKVKDLTASFNSLTESKIRLDKAEKAMERDLTPAEELAAVVAFMVDLEPAKFTDVQDIIRDKRRAARQ